MSLLRITAGAACVALAAAIDYFGPATNLADSVAVGVPCKVDLYYGDNCNAGFWSRTISESLGDEEGHTYFNLGGMEEDETDSVRVSVGCHKVEFWDEDGDRQGYADNFIVWGTSGLAKKDRTIGWPRAGGSVEKGWCFNLPYDLEEDLGGMTIEWKGQCNLVGSPSWGKCMRGRAMATVMDSPAAFRGVAVAAVVAGLAGLVYLARRKAMGSQAHDAVDGIAPVQIA